MSARMTSAIVALLFSAGAWLAPPVAAQTAPADVVARMHSHLEALQRIADENGGNRAAGSPGYAASADYAVKVFKAAGFAVTRQRFEVALFSLRRKPAITVLRPAQQRLRDGRDFIVADFSGSATLRAPIVPARGIVVPPPPNSSLSGCKPGDFPPATRGSIALIQRGGCSYLDKIDNARTAGAAGVLIFNSGRPGERAPLHIIMPEDNAMPVAFLSYETGRALYRDARSGRTVVRLDIRGKVARKATWNVIADSRGGDPRRTLVVGGHLDSVPAGPGINDNGSGTALVLVAAERAANSGREPKHRLRFALWGAEELGLLGSRHYVDTLSRSERKRIFAYLNFDMIGSPNFVRFVDVERGNEAAAAIGALFEAAFADMRLKTTRADSRGRTDTAAFLEAGIPAGGLFSGAEEIKTRAQQKRYGGTAGEALDACYHAACDTIGNTSDKALRQFARAALRVIEQMAREKPPAADAATAGAAAAPSDHLYRGPYTLY